MGECERPPLPTNLLSNFSWPYRYRRFTDPPTIFFADPRIWHGNSDEIARRCDESPCPIRGRRGMRSGAELRAFLLQEFALGRGVASSPRRGIRRHNRPNMVQENTNIATNCKKRVWIKQIVRKLLGDVWLATARQRKVLSY